MGFKVTFLPQNVEVVLEEGTTLLEAQIKAGLIPDAPCGGKGTCGKCLVSVLEGGESNVVKACQTKVSKDLTVDIFNVPKGYNLLTKGVERKITVAPLLRCADVKVERCVIGDNSSDWKRLKDGIAKTFGIDADDIPMNIEAAANLYDVLMANDYLINVVMYGNEIIEIRNANAPLYFMAFDIGTTSVVGYLLDGKSGEEICVSSMLNPQAQFGADVIQRSNYAIEAGVDELSSTIRNALNELIKKNAKTAKIKVEDIYTVTIVGNTCMNHLFLGVSPAPLVHAPYNPALSEMVSGKAADFDININPKGKLIFLPNIAGFVGADTVGVMLATGFDEIEDITLVIDIGTNGELVLGNKKRAITCSTAAGPAFEGAKIECGMRGSEGAIDHITLDGNDFKLSVIGDTKATGICGSGLMDIVCLLLETGMVEESGRIVDDDELITDAAKANAFRIFEKDGKKAVLLVSADESGDGEPVFISQKDIREVQLAKGAMAAGIELMSKELGIKTNDICKVMIAGAFGNYMSPHSACGIGLIPRELEDRIVPIGNAAGEGSKIASLSGAELRRATTIKKNVEFLELATDPDFQDCFVDELIFPEYDI